MTTTTAGSLSIVGLVVLTGTSLARADEPATTARGSLWSGGTLGVADARGWLGRVDGAAIEVGLRSRATATLDVGADEFRVDATIAAALAPAPEGDALVKGSDGLVVDGWWTHQALAWFGPYARVGARASLLRAVDVRDAPTAWRIEREPGRVETVVAERLTLTDPLRPVTLHQSAGALIRPVRTSPIAIDLHAGIGGRETFADGQLAVSDDPATAAVEVLEARDAVQLGAVSGVAIRGALLDPRIRYDLRMDTSFPLAHTTLARDRQGGGGDDRGPMDLATLDASALVSVGICGFASVDYEFEVVREPLVVDAIQFRNVLRLTVGVLAGDDEGPTPR